MCAIPQKMSITLSITTKPARFDFSPDMSEQKSVRNTSNWNEKCSATAPYLFPRGVWSQLNQIEVHIEIRPFYAHQKVPLSFEASIRASWKLERPNTVCKTRRTRPHPRFQEKTMREALCTKKKTRRCPRATSNWHFLGMLSQIPSEPTKTGPDNMIPWTTSTRTIMQIKNGNSTSNERTPWSQCRNITYTQLDKTTLSKWRSLNSM